MREQSSLPLRRHRRRCCCSGGPEDHKAAPFAASLPPTSPEYNERGGGGEMLEVTEDMRKESLCCDDMDFLNNEVQLRIIPVHL